MLGKPPALAEGKQCWQSERQAPGASSRGKDKRARPLAPGTMPFGERGAGSCRLCLRGCRGCCCI